jgi:uncharacterized protein involved in exopolysaccharide biosynthesis
MVISFSQWITSLKRHWLIAGISFAAVGCLTVLVILYGTREYRSVSRLLLRIGHENGTLDPVTTASGERIAPIHTREDEVETAIGVMQSRTIMEEVVAQIGPVRILSGGRTTTDALPTDILLTETAPDHQAKESSSFLSGLTSRLRAIDPISDSESAVRALERGLTISAPSKSSLISVEYKTQSPELAQEIVRTWVVTYLQHNAKVNRTAGTYQFFREQDEKLQVQLQQVHSEIRNAKSSGGFVTLEGQQDILESQLQNVKNELQRVGAELVEADTRVKSYEILLEESVDKLTTEEVSGIASEARNQMRGVLFQLEILEKEYAAKYKEDHPKLKTIREQLVNASKIVSDQESERKQYKQSANPIHQRIRENQVIDMALRDALNGKLIKLAEQQNILLADIRALNGEEEKLVSLLRDAAVLEERNKMHSVLLERARLNEVLDENQITSINVVQPASFEARPVTPNKLMCAIMGMFAAILIAVTLPVLLDAKQILAAAAEIDPLHPDNNPLLRPLPTAQENASTHQASSDDSPRSSPHGEDHANTAESQTNSPAVMPVRLETTQVDQPPTLPR